MKRLAFLSAFALLLGGGTASADPIPLPAGSPISIKFVNAEQINTAVTGCIDVPGTVDYGCSDNWGLINITDISAAGFLAGQEHELLGNSELPQYFSFGQSPAV